MRMLLKVQMDVEAGNRALKDGNLPKIVQGFMEAAKPEGRGSRPWTASAPWWRCSTCPRPPRYRR
jgi:hypothetical protein